MFVTAKIFDNKHFNLVKLNAGFQVGLEKDIWAQTIVYTHCFRLILVGITLICDNKLLQIKKCLNFFL